MRIHGIWNVTQSLLKGVLKKVSGKVTFEKLRLTLSRKKVDALVRRSNLVSEVPIHTNACSVEAPPETIQKSGRKMIVVDVRETMTAKAADYFLKVEPNKDYELIEPKSPGF